MGNPPEEPKDELCVPPLINNVLCYASTARHSMRHDDVVRVCLAFYKEEEILKAKDILYNLVGEKSIRRRNENRMINEIQDLMTMLKKCDDKKIDLPKFVADSYNGLPPSSGFEVVAQSVLTLIDEISSLRKEVESLKESLLNGLHLQNDSDIVKEDIMIIKGELRKLNHKILNDDIKRSSIVLDSMNRMPASASEKQELKSDERERELMESAESPCKIQEINLEENAATLTPSAPPLSQENWSFLDQPFHSGHTPSAPTFAEMLKEHRDKDAKNPVQSPRQGTNGNVSRPITSSQVKVNNEKMANRQLQIDNEGFQKVESRKKRRNNIVGARKVNDCGTIKSAVRSVDVYVGNCDLDVSEESLGNYIKNEIGVIVRKCSLLVSRNTNCNSFKVEMDINVREKVLSPDAWPEGIIIRKFYNPKRIHS